MSLDEKLTSRKEATRNILLGFVFIDSEKTFGFSSPTETSYVVYSDKERLMTLEMRERVILLDSPYSELSKTARKLVDSLKDIGYQIGQTN